MSKRKYRQREHGTDEAAWHGCPCAACAQRRRELAVLAELIDDRQEIVA